MHHGGEVKQRQTHNTITMKSTKVQTLGAGHALAKHLAKEDV